MAYQVDFFDAQRSIERRDIALARVGYSSDFTAVGLAAIESMTGEFTGEDIRRTLTELGIVPHHANAWGALVCTAVRRKLIRETGRYVKMTAVSSHARKTAVYVAVLGGMLLNASSPTGKVIPQNDGLFDDSQTYVWHAP